MHVSDLCPNKRYTFRTGKRLPDRYHVAIGRTRTERNLVRLDPGVTEPFGFVGVVRQEKGVRAFRRSGAGSAMRP